MSLRTEANKSIAYEIHAQLGGVPDIIIVPIGNGSCLAGIWKGFYDLKKLKITKSMPKFVGVCHELSNPIKYAMQNLRTSYTLKKNPSTYYAEGIIGCEAFCSPKIINIVSRGDGVVMEVNDKDIVSMLKELYKAERIHSEPTSAVGLAISYQLRFKETDKVVFILTGRNKNYV